MKTAAARGTVAKESGKIRNVRKAIARVKTVLREQGVRS